MAVAEREARVGNQVGQPVRPAQQAGLAVVGEPLLRAVDGGLEGEGGGGAVLVLKTERGGDREREVRGWEERKKKSGGRMRVRLTAARG